MKKYIYMGEKKVYDRGEINLEERI